ncbi:MAG: DoxX family protein [Acidobacteria bacterium]|nr:DoxX family protein [Acidobacteriota bacterium]
MQRLFSTFPNSWPGLGLLLLRLGLSLAVIRLSIAGHADSPDANPAPQDWIAAAAGTFLLVGLWTPVMGALVAVVEAFSIFLNPSPAHEDISFRILLGILAVSLALLGPGAWSIDARLFGRKRFEIGRSQPRKPLR